MYKIKDSHIHLGHFYDQYTPPTELKDYLDSVGVECFAVSSTTICAGRYDKVINEVKELKRICNNRLRPVLWILPQMLIDGGLNLFMDSDIQWRCLKIHPQLHPTIWLNYSSELQQVVSLSSELQVPLLIHTGEKEGCNPLLYEKAFADYPYVTFILAHGRPLHETITMMKKYLNVWVDTAFMPTENIVMLCNERLSDRVLWGTDYPIPKYYYPNMDMKDYYLNLVNCLKEAVKPDDFEKIICTNFEKLFG